MQNRPEEKTRTVTGQMNIQILTKINYVVTAYDYVLVADAIFKMTIKGDNIQSFSMFVKPDMEKTYIENFSDIYKNGDGTINYEKSTLVKPTIGIQDDFYVWGENIGLNPVQGVGSVAARICIGLGKYITLPFEKRTSMTTATMMKFLGCDDKALSQFLKPLIDSKQKTVSTEKPFSPPKQTLCGFGFEKNDLFMTAVKRPLTHEEDVTVADATNIAKMKLEENEHTKKYNGIKTHREINTENSLKI